MKDIFKVYENRPVGSVGPLKEYAVLVLFVEIGGRDYLLLEKRATHMESQPGEICFPGGMVEEGESPQEGALRETLEEIGLRRDLIRLAGQGDTLYSYANYNLYTFVGRIEEGALQTLTCNEEEVEKVILLPFQDFAERSPEDFLCKIRADVGDFPVEKVGVGEGYPWRVGKWSIPIYKVGGETIWGLTAQIIRNLVENLTGI